MVLHLWFPNLQHHPETYLEGQILCCVTDLLNQKPRGKETAVCTVATLPGDWMGLKAKNFYFKFYP
jgi:hypothetical protein